MKLHDTGAQVDLVDNGRTPLFVASMNGHGKVAKLLLDAGADFDLADKNWQTPLSCASSKGQAELLLGKWLEQIGSGGDVNVIDFCRSLSSLLLFFEWSRRDCEAPPRRNRVVFY